MTLILAALAILATARGQAAQSRTHAAGTFKISCNQKDGRQVEEAELPVFEDDADPSAQVAVAPDDPTLTPDQQRDKIQIRHLDMSRGLDKLAPLTGPTIANMPVLMLRLENLPHFNPARHCNRVFPILSKPSIIRLADGRVRATFDNYSRVFDIKAPPAWFHEPDDTTGRIFWIFPARFGRNAKSNEPFKLTLKYNANFLAASPGSLRRAWTAQAYLDLAMRQYWDKQVEALYALRQIPTRADLNRVILAKTDVDCGTTPEDLICLTDRLLEQNEVNYSAARLNRTAFRTSDAVIARSGLSVGMQQLDVGSGDKQAIILMPKWMASTIGSNPAYRDIIRHWTIDTLNRWYSKDSAIANADLASPQAQNEILISLADWLVEKTAKWRQLVRTAYPSWEPARQSALTMIGMDTENNRGGALYLPAGAGSICEVLTSTFERKARNRRTGKWEVIPSNLNILVSDQSRGRMQEARKIVKTVPGYVESEWTCLNAGWHPGAEEVAPAPAPASALVGTHGVPDGARGPVANAILRLACSYASCRDRVGQ